MPGLIMCYRACWIHGRHPSESRRVSPQLSIPPAGCDFRQLQCPCWGMHPARSPEPRFQPRNLHASAPKGLFYATGSRAHLARHLDPEAETSHHRDLGGGCPEANTTWDARLAINLHARRLSGRKSLGTKRTRHGDRVRIGVAGHLLRKTVLGGGFADGRRRTGVSLREDASPA